MPAYTAVIILIQIWKYWLALSAEIQDSIFETFAGKTKMIVTHDLSLLKKADQVVVLDGGKLVGCGIYHQLKETCPQLQQLLDANISGEERAV